MAKNINIVFASENRIGACAKNSWKTYVPAIAMLAALLVQIGLGISNVVYALPLAVAVAHNGVAAVLLGALTWLAWRNVRGAV